MTASAGTRPFTEGLRHHGWIEGQNLTIEYRWAEGRYERLPDLAADLARLPLDAIFAVNTPTALAMQRTGTTRPVVFAIVSEPVEIGLVDSLPRPGRTFTGLTTINRELMAKCLEVLKETIPTLTRVGYLANPDYVAHAAQHTEMEAAAHRLGLTLHLAEARAPAELEEAFARLAAAHVGAFIVQQDALFGTNRALVIKLATQHRLPSMSWCGSLALHRVTLSFTTPRRLNRAHQERRDGDLVGADGCAAGEAQHDQRRVVSY